MKVYLNKRKRDTRTGKMNVVGRYLVSAELLQKNKHSVIVRLPDGNIIARRIQRDLPEDEIRKLTNKK